MDQDFFAGPRLKIKRANQHIDEIETIVAAFLKTDPCGFSIEAHGETGHILIKVTRRSDVPIDIHLAFGDAIHNMRASLDHIAAAFVRFAGHTDDKVGFPFHADRQSIIDTMKKGPIKQAGAAFCKVVVDYVKPYKNGDGNKLLWAMNKFDNINKHRLLLATAQITGLRASFSDAMGNQFIDCGGTVQDTKEGIIFLIGGEYLPIKFKDVPKTTFDIVTGEPDIFPNQPLIPTLRQFAKVTSEAIDIIERYLCK